MGAEQSQERRPWYSCCSDRDRSAVSAEVVYASGAVGQPSETGIKFGSISKVERIKSCEGDLTRFHSAVSKFSSSEDVQTASEAWVDEVVARARLQMPGGCISEEALAWCTPDRVRVYWLARQGDVDKAGAILAEALQWREKYADILNGRRLPAFNLSDMRVLAMGKSGHPIVYFCTAHQRATSVTDAVEHMAGVLEAAANLMDNGVTQFDIIMDCHGFRISLNLDPRVTLGLMTMLKHPFRDRLRAGFIVDAPRSLRPVWNVAKGALPGATVNKINFVSADEAVQMLEQTHGSVAANVVQHVIRGNRTPDLVQPQSIPIDSNVQKMLK